MILLWGKLESDESPEQYKFRFISYSERWVELSKFEQTCEGLCNLIIKKTICRHQYKKRRWFYSREQLFTNLYELAKLADGKCLDDSDPTNAKTKNVTGGTSDQERNVLGKYFVCNKPRHRAHNCRNQQSQQRSVHQQQWRTERSCYNCNQLQQDVHQYKVSAGIEYKHSHHNRWSKNSAR